MIKTTHLTLEQKEKIIRKAKEICLRWRVDILDCNKSFHRQPIDMPFEDIMKMFSNGCHFVMIHRNLWPDNYLEIGFCTMHLQADYFLWIDLDPKLIPEFEALASPGFWE